MRRCGRGEAVEPGGEGGRTGRQGSLTLRSGSAAPVDPIKHMRPWYKLSEGERFSACNGPLEGIFIVWIYFLL